MIKAEDASPVFTIVLATYNRSHIVGRAIKSVLAQTHRDFELIVVDDASTDDTSEAVASFQDGRVRYLRHESNRGLAAADNTAIGAARGKYVCFLGDDDELLPGFLSETLHRFEAAPTQVGFTGCGIRIVDTSKGQEVVCERLPKARRFSNREDAYLSLLESIPFGGGWGVTIRRECFDVVGLFDEQLQTEADRDLFIRLVRDFDFQVIPKVLVQVHRHSGPHLNIYGFRKAQAFERMLEKHAQTLRSHPRLWARWHYKIGWLYYHSGNRAKGRKTILLGLRRYPLHIKSWAGLIMLEAFGSWGPHVHRSLSNALKRLNHLRVSVLSR